MLSHQQTSRQRRPRLAFLAGLLALVLQFLAPVLPASAMTQAMDLVAATPEEAASFAATCLGLGRPDTIPAAEHQAKCPICLSVAQGHGFQPPAISHATRIAWTTFSQSSRADAPVMESTTRAFASRAPPIA